jgi:hypothetical protein
MRVAETKNQQIVWSATAGYGQGGMYINRTNSTEDAMRAMVADFAKSFPPVPSAGGAAESFGATGASPLAAVTVK